MAQKIKWSIIIVLIGVLFCEVPRSFAQIEFFDGKARLQFILDEYIVWRERIHPDQRVQLSNRLTGLRTRLQMEGRFNLVENENLIINFYSWLNYFYEASPDVNRKINFAMESGKRYKQFKSPLFDKDFDGDDFIMEAYLDINYGPLTFRAGKQKVVWGETEQVQTIDIINPLDLRYSSPGIDDFDELKIGIWMMRLIYQSELPGDLNFEFILNPGDYEQIRLGIQGSDRGAPSVPNEEYGGLGAAGLGQQLQRRSYPAFSLSNYEFGFRLRGLWDFTLKDKVFETLWTLNYFDTLDDVMIVDKIDEYNQLAGQFVAARLNNAPALPSLTGYNNVYDAKRFKAIGGSFQTYDPLLTKGVFRFEFVYYIGRKFNSRTRQSSTRTGIVKRDSISYGLEFIRPFSTKFFKKIDHTSRGYTDVTIGLFQGWNLGNQDRVWRQFSYGERSQTNFTLQLMTHFLSQHITPVFRMRYNTDNWGYMVISTSFSITTNLKWSLGYTENFGVDKTADGIASARDSDRFYTKIKVQF